MSTKNDVLKLVVDSIDLKKLAKGLICDIADEALEEVVQESENDMDNMAKNALWPILEAKMSKLIDEKLDLAKILKLNDEVSTES